MSVIGVVAFAVCWRNSRAQPNVPSTPFLTRLTTDVGMTDYPAISTRGKVLAYPQTGAATATWTSGFSTFRMAPRSG